MALTSRSYPIHDTWRTKTT
ncbi:BnaAnng14810D [Brassica napus]|uniref:BnaAnng14810D protein n=1 Tax=Brassica napus TaxID=3708 RepID=A0A078IZ39_BRANA|nr:BnaAnng14810D [Brassica napus]